MAGATPGEVASFHRNVTGADQSFFFIINNQYSGIALEIKYPWDTAGAPLK